MAKGQRGQKGTVQNLSRRGWRGQRGHTSIEVSPVPSPNWFGEAEQVERGKRQHCEKIPTNAKIEKAVCGAAPSNVAPHILTAGQEFRGKMV